MSRLVAFSVLFLLARSTLVAAEQPNVIIIYTDDQGFGDVGCLNPEAKFATPNLDRIAAEGIAMTNAHSGDSVCTPSRYALLTGRYCWRTSLKRMVMGAEGKCLIRDGQRTIASMLRDQGYATGMVGKWHLGMDFPGEDYRDRDWSQPVRDMPLDKGFDFFYGVPASLNYGVLAWFEGRHAAVPPTLFTAKKPNARHVDYRIRPPYQDTPQETIENVGKPALEVAPDFIDNQCLTRFTDRAIDWMKRTHASDERRPFFLYLPYTSPHYPVCPLPQFHGQGDCGGYGEFVIETDYHIGRILDFLRSSGLEQNTLLVVCSDNGPENSWKQRIEQFGHRSNDRFREGKRSVYEGGHRVPLLIRWPQGIDQPGRRFDGLVGQIDLLATIAEIVDASLNPQDAVDSQSFADVLRDAQAEHRRAPLINHAARGRFAITQDRWKLVLPQGKAKAELYDLEQDPGEQNDVSQDHPEIVKRLTGQITRIVARGRTTPGPSQSNDTGYWQDLAWMSEAEYVAGQSER
ncbi:sulfatase-like hydrolase/transferase [Roseiconus nitratireducens]|uniref:Sulfatase-like hydrolase/transferase n=1 Tax=Roseiconus nitratireducens TaxID=2605748 RepID=A0A5M6D896_9BACT|nr:sulfatase-like hydrolase/transferase [Roseiconus nitratireducens]KAA5542720.1 sulfatase-like hydrolase/transferase [Roseiconus nitratireducens]